MPQRTDTDRVLLAHGGGGWLSYELLREMILPALGSDGGALADASALPGDPDILFTTDAFVVKPLFFPGGDIGRLAIHGTINDLAVSGAEPRAISLALVIEEGLPLDTLRRVLQSAAQAARQCGVPVVTGDTKVVARGEADGLFVVTSGVGKRVGTVLPTGVQAGDRVIVSGPIGEHGVAVMSAREGIKFETTVQSDTASVWPLVNALFEVGLEIHAMRDPTRGGLAASCNELADASGVSVVLDEKAIPVRREVRAACDMLGLDPLVVANEGKVILFVPEREVRRAMDVLREQPNSRNASLIGGAVPRREHGVYLTTRYGGERIVEMPYGEELPRIC